MQRLNLKGFQATIVILLLSLTVHAQGDSLLIVLTEELNREFDVLSKAEEPVYYMDYRAEEEKGLSINASFGSLISSSSYRSRSCQPTVRVGNYGLDNTHESSNYFGYGTTHAQSIPLNTEPNATKQILWRLTGIAYNLAKNQYKHVKILEKKDSVNDFSREESTTFYEPEDVKKIESKKWEHIAKKLSSTFIVESDVISGRVYIDYSKTRKYFVSSEGSSIVQNSRLIQVHVIAQVVNEKHEAVDLYRSFSAMSEEQMPTLDEMLKETKSLITTLKALKTAPYAEPYTGPAILHPRASAVFFHEIFGHRVEGHRLKSEEDGQTFKEKIGAKILPEFINIYADPGLSNYKGVDLNGFYKYDDQGLKGDKVSIVENGILKNFLMSRSPIEHFESSNGHGRSQMGTAPVARQSNLIVETKIGLADDLLRSQLIQECESQGKTYGYYFKDVTGGFTQTSRHTPNAFNIMPTLVYRIYVDGRPDELVKGVDLIGTPLSMFAEVMATGASDGVFNGTCGAESGNIPVSAVAPSILVRRIETQKKPVNNIKSEKPILLNPQLQQSTDEK